MKYALSVPFAERFFDLAYSGRSELAREPEGGGKGETIRDQGRSYQSAGAGYVGMITANSFMKREFGKKLVEEFLPKVDLTHVIDTSGAYIPGHGTPTVILFGRERRPVAGTVRTVMGIKGEPAKPENASQGVVWSAIVAQVDCAGSESEWVSVADTARESFAKHPWSIGGGGAADLKEVIEESCGSIYAVADSVGITSFTLEDEVFIRDASSYRRSQVPSAMLRPMVVGDELRDWNIQSGNVALFPYDSDFQPLDYQTMSAVVRALRAMWAYRTNLSNNKMFGQQTKTDAGLFWWEFGRLTASKLRTPLSIAFAFVATHNHFVLDRGGKVFNRSAPVIKLPAGSTENEHLALLGLLNSSTACFWGRQTFFPKGGFAAGKWEERLEWDGTKLKQFPVPAEKPLAFATELDHLAHERQTHLPAQIIVSPVGASLLANGKAGGAAEGGFASKLAPTVVSRAELNAHRAKAESLLRRMIALQEELDWRCYVLYGVTEEDLCYQGASPLPQPAPARVGEWQAVPEIELGQRAFEIVMARQMARGELETTWFERHRSMPITAIPAHWPADYQRLVERRIALIEADRYIGLIERPEYLDNVTFPK